MLGLNPDEISDDLKLSVAAEICNQIAGILQGSLQDKGINFDLSSPHTYTGTDLIVPHPGSNLIGRVKFYKKSGSIFGKLINYTNEASSVEVCLDKVS